MKKSDFILDLNEPLGKLAYINECMKNKNIPHYIVIDNPFSKSNEEKEFSLDKSKFDMIHYTQDKDTFNTNESIIREKNYSLSSMRKSNFSSSKYFINSNTSSK
jgi:hypothetical protein